MFPLSRLLATIALTAVGAAATVEAWAADPDKVLRIEFYVAETGFDPVKVQDYYSQEVRRPGKNYTPGPAQCCASGAQNLPYAIEISVS